MTVIHDELGKGVTEFPSVGDQGRVMPVTLYDANGNAGLPSSTTTIGKVYVTDGVEEVNINSSNQMEVANFGAYDRFAQDASTEAIETIAYAHHEIHSGNHFYIEGFTTLGDEVGVDDALRVKLVTPNSPKLAHFQWAIASTGILTTTFHEGASGGMANGGEVTPLNNNRNSTNTSGLVLTSGVTAADTPGTLVSNAKWGAAGFKTTIGGGDSRDDEIILKRNTTYLRTFTSSATSNIVQFKASWYEHVDKN